MGYQQIDTLREFMDALAEGPWTSLGGYPKYFCTKDESCISFATAWRNRDVIAYAMTVDRLGGYEREWDVAFVAINYEDDLEDDWTNNAIEAAYIADGDRDRPIECFNKDEWEAYRAWMRRYTSRREAREARERQEQRR